MLAPDLTMADVLAILRGQRELILERWLAAARAQPFHHAHPDNAVTDHMPRILDALLRSLEGEVSADDAGHVAAMAHAKMRAAQGLNSGDVVTEFRLLRAELSHAVAASVETVGPNLLAVEARLHDGLDALISTVLRAFDLVAQSRASGLDALEHVAREISALRPLDETLNLLCDRARDLLQADQAFLALPDPDGVLRFRAVSGLPDGVVPAVRIVPGEGVTGRVFVTGEAALTVTSAGSETDSLLSPAERSGNMHNLMVMPLRRGAQVVGTLSVGSAETRSWSAGDLALLEALAAQAAVAVDNARLYSTLAQRERLLDQVVRNAPALIAVLRGPEHRFDLANPLLEALVRSGSLVGQRAVEVLPHLAERPWLELLNDARGGEAVLVEDLFFRVPASDDIDLQGHHFRVSLLPLTGDTGDESDVLFVGHEITETIAQQARIEALARLAAARADTLAAVIGAIPDGVFVCDAASLMVTANDSGAALLGLTREEAQRPLAVHGISANVRAPDGRDFQMAELPLMRAIQGEVATNLEMLVRRADTGEDRMLRVSVAPIRDLSGVITGGVCVAHDVTTLRQLERQKDEFVSRASHELKTPLTGAKGLLQLASRRLARGEDGSQVRNWIEKAAQQVDRLTSLVDDLREVSHLRMGQLRLRLGMLELNTVLDRSAEVLQSTTEQHTIRVLHSAMPAQVKGDMTRLQQVLDNLISNAIKYSPQGGDIDIVCSVVDDWVAVEVRDRGIGVPEPDRASLFEPFHRAANADTASTGMGLGLYISREIARQHGGDLVLASSGPDGTVFRLTLPLAPSPVAPDEPS